MSSCNDGVISPTMKLKNQFCARKVLLSDRYTSIINSKYRGSGKRDPFCTNGKGHDLHQECQRSEPHLPMKRSKTPQGDKARDLKQHQFVKHLIVRERHTLGPN